MYFVSIIDNIRLIPFLTLFSKYISRARIQKAMQKLIIPNLQLYRQNLKDGTPKNGQSYAELLKFPELIKKRIPIPINVIGLKKYTIHRRILGISFSKSVNRKERVIMHAVMMAKYYQFYINDNLLYKCRESWQEFFRLGVSLILRSSCQDQIHHS